MIEAVLFIGLGAFLSLYFSNVSFYTKINELLIHTKDLFKRKVPQPPPLPEDKTTPIP